MNRLKTMIMIAGLLFVSLFLYFFYIDTNQPKEISVTIQTPSLKEQVESKSAEPVKEASAEPQVETVEAIEEKTTLADEIKEKVRAVLEGTINLFKQDLRIVAIGDSLTQGVGDETESGGYVGILNNTFEDNDVNVRIKNYGKRGNRTDQLLKRLEDKKIASSIKSAEIVLITIGANDIMQVAKNNLTNLNMEPFQEEQQGYTTRLTAIFDKINELNPDTQIYLIGFYNPFERYFSEIEELGEITKEWNLAGKSVTEEYENVHFIPIEDIFTYSETNLLADDYFHPNTSGYIRIAKRVLEYMNEITVETEVVPEVVESP